MKSNITRRLRRKASSYQPALFTRAHDIELRALPAVRLVLAWVKGSQAFALTVARTASLAREASHG
jgi:hypothetical protein